MKVYVVQYGEGRIKAAYTDEKQAEADVANSPLHFTWYEAVDVVDWDARQDREQSQQSDPYDFRSASIQPIVSQPSLTTAMTRAWLAWLAYNQPDTKVSGDEFVEGKLVRSGETAAEAWSRLQNSESEREFLKLQSLVPTEPQR